MSKQDIIEKVKQVIPVEDRIVIVPEETEKVTKGGVARAQTKKGEDTTQIGTVIAVGKGWYTETGQFIEIESPKVGDRVLLDRYAGVDIRVTKDGKILPSKEDVTDDRLPVKIVSQRAILWIFPQNF